MIAEMNRKWAGHESGHEPEMKAEMEAEMEAEMDRKWNRKNVHEKCPFDREKWPSEIKQIPSPKASTLNPST